MSHPVALLTNDDGVTAAGINAMRTALVDNGVEVYVIAPDGDRSATGHRVCVGSSLSWQRIDEKTIACEGSPADCVRLGVLSDLIPAPGLVVSGINHGSNAGEDMHYSGTVAAAAEAILLGLPAMAVSQNTDPSMDFLASVPDAFPDAWYAAGLAARLPQLDVPEGTLISLNLPYQRLKGPARFARLGRRDWSGAQMALLHDGAHSPWHHLPATIADEGSDYQYLRQGHGALNLLSLRGGLHDVVGLHQDWVSSIEHHLNVGPVCPGNS